MKTDLQGRLIDCQQRAAMIADILQLADNSDHALSTDGLLGVGGVATDLAEHTARARNGVRPREANAGVRQDAKGKKLKALRDKLGVR